MVKKTGEINTEEGLQRANKTRLWKGRSRTDKSYRDGRQKRTGMKPTEEEKLESRLETKNRRFRIETGERPT